MRKIFITRQLMPIAHELLSPHFTVEENRLDRTLSREELKRAVKNFDGILSTIPDKLDKEILQESEKLKVISNCAAGLDNVDQLVARERNIAVYNVPDAATQSTADMTWALLLSLIRRVGEAERYVKQGLWKGWEPALLLGEELTGKNFGILGYGKIGKAVAERALGFGMSVLVFARSKQELSDPRIRQVPLEELYDKADYISIHLPLTPETQGMLNRETFKKMRKKPVIVNMARGGIIRTDDLVQALKEGAIRGAALDVTDPEPLPGTHPLCQLSNCLVVPHIGSATVECRTIMTRKAAENLIQFFHDQP
jgi:glyoxylate reductase